MGQARTTKETTIVALCTPAAMGALAVIRLSGAEACTILSRAWRGKDPNLFADHTAHLGYITAQDNTEIDQVVATYFRAPNSFTGEETVEISCHGSVWIQQAIVDRLIETGATPAAPGEFSQRAFINGRLDLAEAEAVADLIASQSRASQRLAMSQMKGEFSDRLRQLRGQLLTLLSLLELELDFSEEDVEFADRRQLLDLARTVAHTVDSLADSFAIGNALKQGIPIVLAGATNTGKSTLLNRLLQQPKAIVSDIHGTTRDIIEDTFHHRGLQYRLIDTAGLRHTLDPIENLGIDRTRHAISRASLVLWLIDPQQPTWPTPGELPRDARVIPLINKSDLPIDPDACPLPPEIEQLQPIRISALTGEGIEELLRRLHSIFSSEAERHDIIITNARHLHALRQASAPLHRVIAALDPASLSDPSASSELPDPSASPASSELSELSASSGLSASSELSELSDPSASSELSGIYSMSSMSEPTEIIAQDIRQAISALSEITGDITTADLLSNIFTHFCIGK